MCELRSVPYLIAVLSSAALAAAEPLADSYSVYVATRGARVYSGPGSDYYATQELSAGTECQVYEELNDGWLAIRPPAGSYSLVLRSALDTSDGKVAKVARGGTPSRIGSVLVDKFGSVHVRLDEGELVQLTEDGSRDGSQWATIAPPAGEFRWIRADDVVRSSQAVNVSATVEIEPNSATPDEWRERPTDESVQQDDQPIRAASHNAEEEPQPTDAPTTLSLQTSSSFEAQLHELEIQLSRRVAGPVNLWIFDDLQRRAAQLVSSATTSAEQQLVENVANRLSRFESIGKRYRSVQSNSDPTTNSIAAETNSSIAGDSALEHYDAVGILRPVVSQRGNAPPYALVDDAGQIVTFITPSPSLNLQHHLGQRVGVSGTRGFLPEFRSRNIQTARVAPVGGYAIR